MAAPLITAPPRETPFLAKDGRVSTPWISWLYSITAAGVVVQTLQTLQIIAEDNSTDANTAAILAELTDTLLLLAEPRRREAEPDLTEALFPASVPRLEAPDPVQAAETIPAAALRAELDELRMLIHHAVPSLGSAAYQTGVSGQFTSAGGSTITVTNGVITQIL